MLYPEADDLFAFKLMPKKQQNKTKKNNMHDSTIKILIPHLPQKDEWDDTI